MTAIVSDAASQALAGPVDYRVDGRTVWLTLNRPGVGNAIDQGLAEALRDAVRRIRAAPEPRIVVLQAAGNLFCAGGDVAAITGAADPLEYITTLATTVHGAIEDLRASDAVVIAAVHGPAAGGGLGLVLNADFVIASTDARFLSAYASVGLSPDCGVSYMLPAIVGPRRAMELTLTGRVLDAYEAREWGIVTEVTGADDFDARVQDLAHTLARGPALAQARTRM